MDEQPPLAVRDTSFRSADPAARLITVPSALIGPVSGVIGRMNDILNSRVVEPTPLSKVDWIASPMQLSSIVAARPPCTVPAGFSRLRPQCLHLVSRFVRREQE
jgi:hypothetical protein